MLKIWKKCKKIRKIMLKIKKKMSKISKQISKQKNVKIWKKYESNDMKLDV